MYHQVIDCEVEAPLDFFLDEETHQWVVDCPCLKITTQAETKEKAHGAFAEALALWLASCINRNTLTGALQELGFVRGSLPYGQGESPQQIAYIRVRTLVRPLEVPSFPVDHADVAFDVQREIPIWAARFPAPATSPVSPGIYHAHV